MRSSINRKLSETSFQCSRTSRTLYTQGFSAFDSCHKYRLVLAPCSDFLESLDEGSFFSQAAINPSFMNTSPYANPVTLGVDSHSYNMTDTHAAQQHPHHPPPHPSNDPAPPAPEKPSEEPPPIVLSAPSKTERFFLTAADQSSGTRNERLNMVIRSKYEAGLLKPYNYVKGYARLSRWMDRKYVCCLGASLCCFCNVAALTVLTSGPSVPHSLRSVFRKSQNKRFCSHYLYSDQNSE